MTGAERHTQTCVTCGAQSPDTETNYTLISSRFGWRLHRFKDATGEFVLEWYCPKCWARRKAARGAPPSSR